MLPDSFGNSLRAIIRHDGQHDVARNFCREGTFSTKSRASSIAHTSAPAATSTTSEKPSFFIAATNFGTVTFFPNCRQTTARRWRRRCFPPRWSGRPEKSGSYRRWLQMDSSQGTARTRRIGHNQSAPCRFHPVRSRPCRTPPDTGAR